MSAMFNNKAVTVLGAGESGMAAAPWLVRQGAVVTVSDSRPVDEWNREFVAWCERHGVRIEAGGHSKAVCTLCDFMVASPGIPATAAPIRMAMDAGVAVVNDLVLAACFRQGPMIAVTGTNGKTTTTMLIVHLLENSGIKAVAAGNISPPLFDAMEREDIGTTLVLEVSSFQMELLEREWRLPFPRPDISVAIWLNLAPDHLDRHGDMKHYGECKARLLDLQGPYRHAVINADDNGLFPWRHEGQGRRFWFGEKQHSKRNPGAWFSKDGTELVVDMAGEGVCGSEKERYDLSSWCLSGRHNLENLAAAVAAARLSGASCRDIQRSLCRFRPPPHRFETVAFANGITYIDDSKATNVAAALRAFEASQGPVVLIAGGQGKNEDYLPLAQGLKRLAFNGMLRAVLLIGRDAHIISQAIGRFPEVREVMTAIPAMENGRVLMREAVKMAMSAACSGDVVLLSPACASFDLFSDYRERGRVFRNAVMEMAVMQDKRTDVMAA